jgi:hypothetical protein
MKAIILAAIVSSLLFFADGCQTASHRELPDIITVRDSSGEPVVGAAILFDQGILASLPYFFSAQETKERTTDSSGRAKIDLRKHGWDDGTYHFVVRKRGYQDAFLEVTRAEYRGEIVVDLKLADKSMPAADEQVVPPSGTTSSGKIEPGTVRTRSFDSSGRLIDEKQSSQSAQPQPSGK